MSEVRLTFSTGDFSAVSQALIEMGVSFRVDPLTRPPEEESEPAPVRAQPKSKPAQKKAKAGKASRPSQERSVTAAERLRDAISRTAGEAVPFPPAVRTPPEEEG
jgi:hypothetical protein